jgi:hypothetical protein
MAESPMEAQSLSLSQTSTVTASTTYLWPGPFRFMYETEFLPTPYSDGDGANCDCVTQWEHNYFACRLFNIPNLRQLKLSSTGNRKRDRPLIPDESWKPGGSNYEGMTQLLLAAMQDMQYQEVSKLSSIPCLRFSPKFS